MGKVCEEDSPNNENKLVIEFNQDDIDIKLDLKNKNIESLTNLLVYIVLDLPNELEELFKENLSDQELSQINENLKIINSVTESNIASKKNNNFIHPLDVLGTIYGKAN